MQVDESTPHPIKNQNIFALNLFPKSNKYVFTQLHSPRAEGDICNYQPFHTSRFRHSINFLA